MKRSLAVLTAIVTPLVLGQSQVVAGASARPSLAIQLSQRMVHALEGQRRIVVRGWTQGPGLLKTRYLMRYLAIGRESMVQTGGPWGQVQVHGKPIGTVSAIYIGKHAFTSMDGQHWYRTSRSVPPRALDVISLNIANTPCCVPDWKGSSVKLTDGGTRHWRGATVHALRFSCLANGYAVAGTLLLDRRTFLPLRYVQKTRIPKVSGTFTLSYGGSFTIAAPR
jgi:hypothetical protein